MNNFSVLPFYSSVAEQNHRLPYAYGAVYPLYCDDTRILPFQIIRPTRQNTITSVILFDKDGTQVRDLTSDMSFDIVALEDYDVIVYTAQFGYAQELPIGQYYISVSDGAQTWYSDIFTIVSDITPYVKLEWYDEENFVMDAGTIIYKNPRFINRLYLKTEIGKPDYQFEEEGEQRDGYFFPEKQLSEKTYRFTILAPEYLCDVMRFIRMADHIQITADGYTYNADTFLITPKWQTQGDLASVEVEFESNTVAKKLGDARVRRTIGDFNDDYNDDYDGGDTPVPPVPSGLPYTTGTLTLTSTQTLITIPYASTTGKVTVYLVHQSPTYGVNGVVGFWGTNYFFDDLNINNITNKLFGVLETRTTFNGYANTFFGYHFPFNVNAENIELGVRNESYPYQAGTYDYLIIENQ